MCQNSSQVNGRRLHVPDQPIDFLAYRIARICIPLIGPSCSGTRPRWASVYRVRRKTSALMEAWHGQGPAGHDRDPERVILLHTHLVSGAGESSLAAIDTRTSKWLCSGFRVPSPEEARLADEMSRGGGTTA